MDIFQMKIQLQNSDPLISKRVLVRSSTKLSHLHFIIQDSMGLEDRSKHHFDIDGEYYGNPVHFRDSKVDATVKNEDKFALARFYYMGIEEFIYEHDFGDGRIHDVIIEKALPEDPSLTYPVCIDG